MANELTFYERLNKAQNELKAPKGQYNSFGKYKYRSAEDILEAVKPVNSKHDIHLSLSDKPVAVGDRIYIEATAILVNVQNTDEKLIVTAYAREAQNKKGMDDSQITGTASSYARKYALNGLYLIDDTKDADTNEARKQADNAPNNSNNKPPKNNKQKSSQQSQQNDQFTSQRININERLSDLAKLKNTTTQKLNSWVIAKTNEELSQDETKFSKENASTYNGFLRQLEQKAKLEDTKAKKQQSEQTSLMDGNTTTAKEGN